MAKYKLSKTEPRNDGSGMITWEVWALDDDGLVIPGKHADILTPYDETQEALNAPNPGAALRKLLIKYLPAQGWSNSDLDKDDAANKNAATVNEAVGAYVTGNLGGFPVVFNA